MSKSICAITIISQPSPLLWRRINLLHLYAPDDVNDMDVIRWAQAHAAYTSKGAFPETVPIEFIRALQGQSNRDNHRVCVLHKTMRSYLTCETRQCSESRRRIQLHAVRRSLNAHYRERAWAFVGPEEQTIRRQSIGCNFTRCVRSVCWNFDVKEANKRQGCTIHNT